jgi:hypothetical protein
MVVRETISCLKDRPSVAARKNTCRLLCRLPMPVERQNSKFDLVDVILNAEILIPPILNLFFFQEKFCTRSTKR